MTHGENLVNIALEKLHVINEESLGLLAYRNTFSVMTVMILLQWLIDCALPSRDLGKVHIGCSFMNSPSDGVMENQCKSKNMY